MNGLTAFFFVETESLEKVSGSETRCGLFAKYKTIRQNGVNSCNYSPSSTGGKLERGE